MAKRRAHFLLKQDREADIRLSLQLDSGLFADAAPIPPVAFLARQLRVARLFDGTDKGVVDAGVHASFGDLAEAVVELIAFATGELGYGANTEKVEISEHRASDAVEVGELACVFFK